MHHAEPPNTRFRSWRLIVAVLVIADVTATFETQMILAAIKVLYADFRDPAAVAWMVTIYLLVSSVAAPIVGRLGDLFGRKRMIVISVGMSAAGSALSAIHPDAGWVIAGRALQGMAGGVLPLCYGIVREAVPPEKHSLCGGLLVGATSVGAIAGLVIGGVVVDNFHWRALFWLSAGMGGVAAVLAATCLPAGLGDTKVRRRLDLGGGALFVTGVSALLLIITRIGEQGGLDGPGLAGVLAVVMLMGGWVWHELRHPDPLFNVRLLATREMALTNAVILLLALGPFQLTLVMMLLLQSRAPGMGLGLSASVAGFLKIPGNAAAGLASPIAGSLCSRIGERGVILSGLICNAAAWLYLLAGPGGFASLVAVIVVSSIGTTVTYVGVTNQIARIASADRVSEALGLSAAIRSIAHACGTQVMTFLLGSAALGADAGMGAGSGYSRVFCFVFLVCLAGMGVAAALPRRRST